MRAVLRTKFISLCVERGISPSVGFVVLKVQPSWRTEWETAYPRAQWHFNNGQPPISLVYGAEVLTSEGKIFSVVLPTGFVHRSKYLESWYAKKWKKEEQAK